MTLEICLVFLRLHQSKADCSRSVQSGCHCESGRSEWHSSPGVGEEQETEVRDFYTIKSLGPFMHWRGNGNPLQYSCLENPRGGGAWWAAVYGVAQSRTRLKQLSSSSSSDSLRARLSSVQALYLFSFSSKVQLHLAYNRYCVLTSLIEDLND